MPEFTILKISLDFKGEYGYHQKAAYANGVLAQLGEHLPYKQRVIGSSPIGPIDVKASE